MAGTGKQWQGVQYSWNSENHQHPLNMRTLSACSAVVNMTNLSGFAQESGQTKVPTSEDTPIHTVSRPRLQTSGVGLPAHLYRGQPAQNPVLLSGPFQIAKSTAGPVVGKRGS